MGTHKVTNQAPARGDIDEYQLNVALCEAVDRLASDADRDELHRIGRLVGSAEFQRDAELANIHPPVLHTHDRWGHRVDDVEFHPAYHTILGAALRSGAHSHAWRQPGPGATLERAARFMLYAQVEPGHACPVSMTHSAVAALADTVHAEFWLPRLQASAYDPRLIDPAEKRSVTFGMAMTEKQGGSDVRANTTHATPQPDESHLLTGHKWFCSAPQSDAFLVLAHTEPGLSCFLVPRILPGGARNPFAIQRLKDKLGNHSNASCEVEFDGTRGWLVGHPGRGVATIIEMVNRTRLDCVLGTTAGMRQATAEAAWHARHRRAFGHLLVDQPLMRAVLADLQLETEAATWTAAHLASLHDEGAEGAPMRRLATALAKYWVCKRGPGHAYEGLECLGGNGYTEDFPLARRYREQPVLAVWEGSGNVMVLDVLRALDKDLAGTDLFVSFLSSAAGRHDIYDQAHRATLDELRAARELLRTGGSGTARAQAGGRLLIEHLAQLLQAAVLLTHAPTAVAEAYLSARLGKDRGAAYGALPDGIDVDLLVDRAGA